MSIKAARFGEEERRKIMDRWREYFAEVKKVLKLLPDDTHLEAKDDLKTCLVSVYRKQLNLYCGCYKLCELGLGNEARILDRAMYETWLLLERLDNSANPSEFASDWIAWGYANEYVLREQLFKRHPEIAADRGVQRYKEILEGKSQAARDKFGKDWKEFVRRGPAMAGPSRLSKDKGPQLVEYYSDASGPVHSYDIHLYSPDLDQPDVAEFLDGTDEVLEHIIIWISKTIEIVNAHLKFVDVAKYQQLMDVQKHILNN